MDAKYSSKVPGQNLCDLPVKMCKRELSPTNRERFAQSGFATYVPWDASFSMGSAKKLTRIVLWQYGWGWYDTILYAGGNDKKYEFYGSNKPSESGELDDSWTLFLTATIEGSYANEKERRNALLKGHEFKVPDETSAYRYIRMKCVEAFSGTQWGKSAKTQIFVDNTYGGA